MADKMEEPSKLYPQYLAATAANLATVAAGCALGWTSPAQPKISTGRVENEVWASFSEEETSWIGSLVPAGAILGPFLGGYLADKIGRKWTLISSALPALVGWIMIIFVAELAAIYAARFIIGISVGMVFTVAPMYVGEIAEDRVRGALGSFLQLLIVVGFLYQYCIGPYVTYSILAIVTSVVPITFAVSFFFFPESPYYLLAKEREEEAAKSLQWFRGQSKEGIQQELKQMRTGVEEEMRNKAKLSDLIATKGNIKALYISLGLVGFQQLSGINAVLFYSQSIFTASGGSLQPEQATIIIGVVMFLASGVTPLIVERLGKKIILLFSAGGMVIALGVLGVYFFLKNNDSDVSSIGWLPVLSLVLYIMVYSPGFGSLPWAVMGELFPANIKGNASACTASFCWLIGFFITKFYSNLATSIGNHYTFWIFAVFAAISAVFLIFVVPETKGKSLQEIQDILNK